MTEQYTGPDRRTHVQLTDEQIDLIATKAATRAVAMMTASAYQEVGKRTVKGVLYAIGVATVMFLSYLLATGKVKL